MSSPTPRRFQYLSYVTRQLFELFCSDQLIYTNWKLSITEAVILVSWFLFVCLFVYRLTREFFTHLETSPLPMKGCKFLTNARHSWPLSNKGNRSVTCHTYCDTDLPFIMVISEDPWHSHLLPRVWQWSCHFLAVFST